MDLWLLWGKTTGMDGASYHPVLCHMLDVAHVARCLLKPPASLRWRTVLGRALGANPDTLADWLPWLVGLHDIGKVSAAFQLQDEAQANRLRVEGVRFGEWRKSLEVHHSSVGQFFAVRTADSHLLDMPWRLRSAWAHMVAGHHGRYAVAGQLVETRQKIECYEPTEWGEWRALACESLYETLAVQLPVKYADPPNVSAAIATLTGFTILCDWLGSDTSFFKPQPTHDLISYARASMCQAMRAVTHVGLAGESASQLPGTFVTLFPDKVPIRPLQEAMDTIPAALLDGPCLAIIEAPTGEGKTEAALALAHRMALSSGTDELYYALPTTATSNQMFGRLEQYLSRRLKMGAHVKLVHGQAFLVEDDLRLAIAQSESFQGPAAALEWFGPLKRAVLAPFGVGTIDQCELAALNVRHGALRLIGLAGKVIILDEVHAYDVYMTAIVERLLTWLAALGTSVVLLSATLPKARRQSLVRAYGVEVLPMAESTSAYPSVCVAGQAGSFHSAPTAAQPERHLALEWLHVDDGDDVLKARWLHDQVRDGGCACWITNTVDRAQRLYAAVRAAKIEDIDCLLLHARFPLERRAELEAAVTIRYGPPDRYARRPTKGIVIGTQVLEQSLDLDFDVMATDLSPVDLLLQRAGRLHRHTRPRPASHTFPRLAVQVPLDDAGLPCLDTDRHIYAEYILFKTWEVLRERAAILLPADYRTLIDDVYQEPGEPQGARLAHALASLKEDESMALQEAKLRLLPLPHPEQPFCAVSGGQFEESETLASWAIARTRLGEESITVIPMEREGCQARLCLLEERFDLNHEASRAVQLRLLRYGLRVSNRAAVPLLREQAEPLPRLFSRSALLRDTLPLWLMGGRAVLPSGRGTLVLELDVERGLVITRKT
ncbi:MAG: CRISPR-associated helicase Cas3' [Anaerolineae bacterium]